MTYLLSIVTAKVFTLPVCPCKQFLLFFLKDLYSYWISVEFVGKMKDSSSFFSSVWIFWIILSKSIYSWFTCVTLWKNNSHKQNITRNFYQLFTVNANNFHLFASQFLIVKMIKYFWLRLFSILSNYNEKVFTSILFFTHHC